MSTTSLSLSTVLNVSVVVSASGSPGPTFNQALIVGSSPVIPNSQRVRQYTSTSAMLGDGFSTTSPEYQAAQIYFSQAPAPTYLNVGLQDLTAMQTVSVASAGSGYAVGDILAVGGGIGGQVQVATITTGGDVSAVNIYQAGTGYTVESGQATTPITGSGSGCTISILSIGETPLQAVSACRAASPQWYACMFVSPVESGAAAATTATAAALSSDITLTSGTGVSVGQVITGVGIAPNTKIASGSGMSWVLSQPTTAALSTTAVAFYPAVTDTDYINIAGFIQSCSPPSVFFLNSGSSSILYNTPGNLFATLQSANRTRTLGLYSTVQSGAVVATPSGTASSSSSSITLSSSVGVAIGQTITGSGIPTNTYIVGNSGTNVWLLSQPTTAPLSGTPVVIYSAPQAPGNIYAAAAPMGLAMGLNTGSAGSYFDLMFKPLSGITTEPLTQTQVNTICGTVNRSSVGLNGNAYLNFANGAYAWMQNATMFSSSGSVFFDQILFLDMLASQIQYNGTNLLVSVPSLPITNSGVAMMVNSVSQACTQSKTQGFIAPSGVWLGVPVGPIQPGTPLPSGFYVYAPPVGSLTQGQRAARQLPPINVLLIEAQSGHSVNITVNVQQ